MGTLSLHRESYSGSGDLDGDKFRSFNHREELDSAVQFQFGPVSCYI